MNLEIIENQRSMLGMPKQKIADLTKCDVMQYNRITTLQGGTVKKFIAILDILGLELKIQKK